MPSRAQHAAVSPENLAHRPLHVFVSRRVDERIHSGGRETVEEREELALVLAGHGPGLHVHVDSAAIEEGHQGHVRRAGVEGLPAAHWMCATALQYSVRHENQGERHRHDGDGQEESRPSAWLVSTQEMRRSG